MYVLVRKLFVAESDESKKNDTTQINNLNQQVENINQTLLKSMLKNNDMDTKILVVNYTDSIVTSLNMITESLNQESTDQKKY